MSESVAYSLNRKSVLFVSNAKRDTEYREMIEAKMESVMAFGTKSVRGDRAIITQ
jgi:hypothetical protein